MKSNNYCAATLCDWVIALRAGILMAAALASCGGEGVGRPKGWTEATHGKKTPPNYDLLFGTSTVHSVEIKIAASDFQAMQDDLGKIKPSAGALTAADDGSAMKTACDGLAAGAACEFTIDGNTTSGTCVAAPDIGLICMPTSPGGEDPSGGNHPTIDNLQDPIYVPVEVHHDGHTWWHVGMRYKGFSSLISSQNGKLPFRLDFEKFEDKFPKIKNQRFYGFEKLTFSSNFGDDSQIRDLYVSELLRDRGVPAARCAFYRVFVDVGNGSVYWGLYTMIEDPSDGAMLASQFGGRGGNLYKPDGDGADWTHFSKEGFVKKTNKDQADWSDVESAISALHADKSDAATWRSNLEATFDVNPFLTWLAVNTVIVNWDSYGAMAHNYYLYGDPAASGRLKWIPWDHNLSMQSTNSCAEGDPNCGGPAADEAVAEIFHRNVGDSWPLISTLLSDETYAATYREAVTHALGGLFGVEEGAARMRELHDLIAPYVVGTEGELSTHTTIISETAFQDSIDGENGLAAFIAERHARVEEALASQ